MSSKGFLAVAAVLLLSQAALAQECDSEISAAREAQCPKDVFAPKSCRSALMDGSTAYRAYAAVWMANAAYDDKEDGVTWETAARRSLAVLRFSDMRFGSQGGIEFFVADSPDYVWVVFRGSDTNIDWQTNFKTDFVTVTGLGQVHKGFWEAFKAVQPTVSGYVNDFASSSSKGVVYAGHSLGAAIATLAAANRQYNKRDSVANVFTFGSPRVGDATWAQSYVDLGLDQLTYRYVTDRDPVAMVPPGGSIGFRHVGNERRLFSGSPGDCKANAAASSCPSGSTPSVVDGMWKKVTDAVCNNGFIRGAIDVLAPIVTDISFTATDLLNAEPTICCSDIESHDPIVYMMWVLGGCLSPCERLVHCSCQQDAPESVSVGAPAPAGDSLQPNLQDSAPEELQPVQQPEPEPSPEPPRNPDTAVYRIVVQTACEAYAGTDANWEIKLTDAQGRWYRTGYLDNPGDDLAQCTQDTYDLGTWQWVDLSSTAMQVYFKSTSLIWGEWRPAWIQVVQNPGTNQVASRSFCYDGFLTTAGWYSFNLC